MSALAADPQPPAANQPPIDMPATSAGVKVDPLFNQLDSNHDGFVSKEEAKRSADITARFDSMDSNHDGGISAAEFSKPQSPQSKP
jgi:Ca2+-binding EF-hand superfamily protein